MRKMTQEFRRTSANQLIEWQVEGFYTRETSAQYEFFTLNDLAGVPQPSKSLHLFRCASRYTEYAAFADATWHITDKFDVTGGIRYARDDQQFSPDGRRLFKAHPNLPPTQAKMCAISLGTIRYHFLPITPPPMRATATGYRPGSRSTSHSTRRPACRMGRPHFTSRTRSRATRRASRPKARIGASPWILPAITSIGATFKLPPIPAASAASGMPCSGERHRRWSGIESLEHVPSPR